jgi:FkbM family methyltransferase
MKGHVLGLSDVAGSRLSPLPACRRTSALAGRARRDPRRDRTCCYRPGDAPWEDDGASVMTSSDGQRSLWRTIRAAKAFARAISAAPASLRKLQEEFSSVSPQLQALEDRVARMEPRSAYVGDGRAWVRTTWGGKLLVDTRDLLLAPWLLLDGGWEPEVTAFIQATLKPEGVFVDVGANLGYYSILAGSLVGWGGKVYAFEPNPKLYDLLRKAVIANWMTSFVTSERIAVYEDTRVVDFFVSAHFAGNSTLAPLQVGEGEVDAIAKMEVQAISLDEYFADIARPIDMVKIDVEGAELQVFRGMRGVLERNRDVVVVCEWSQGQLRDSGTDPGELLTEFTRGGFDVYRLEPELARVDPPQMILDVPYCDIALIRPGSRPARGTNLRMAVERSRT